MRHLLIISLFFLSFGVTAAQSTAGNSAGSVRIRVKNSSIEVENNSLKAKWQVINRVVYAQNFVNKETKQKINWQSNSWFYLELENGERLTSKDFILTKNPVTAPLYSNAQAIKISDRFKGQSITADFYNEKTGLTLHWELSLKEESNYVKQKFTLSAKDSVRVSKIGLIELPKEKGLIRNGVVAGSPLTGNGLFFAFEHPMSHTDTLKQSLGLYIKRYKPVTSGNPLTFSAIWGMVQQQQLRRSFLYYLERERAVPYHHQLHYNSWYDISWEDRKLDEASCLDRIQTFADSLIVKRKTSMDAFLFDDGWDNNQTLWQFNDGFPGGFSKLSERAKKYNSDLGIWISPWGGYDQAKIQRLEYGQKQIPPFETNANGFTLSGNNYYKRFFDVASGFVKNQGIEMFKFDGVGAGDGSAGANASYEKDIDALLKLIPDLRMIKPDLYFSLTVGTWPSPYWLYYGDAIWRNGSDTGLSGDGSKRQQWMSFRDGEAYKNIVKRGPLYPLNSLMYHGICIADQGVPGSLEMSDKDIADEIWSFFGTGTSLQELYINPHKLNSNNWDCLAKAINWAKENENIQVDTHWVGGSPSDNQVYGFASWSPQKAILTLRNPSTKKQKFKIDVVEVFETPNNKKIDYKFFDARTGDKMQPIASGSSFEIELQPLEVKVFDAFPVK